MLNIGNVKMRTKFTAIFLAVGIIPFATIGLISLKIADSSFESMANKKLVAVREIKRKQLQNYFHDTFLEMAVFSRSKDVSDLTRKLKAYHRAENHALDGSFTTNTAEYRKIVDESGGNLIRFARERGLHSVFILDVEHGHVMFSSENGSDLGTSLSHGPYRQSSLAKLWKKVVANRQLSVVDFEPYGPDDDRPALFAGYPIFNADRELIGVIAFQIKIENINAIITQQDGMGKTGEAYLVGPDRRMRSDSLLNPEQFSVKASFAHPDRGRLNTEAVNKALAGKRGESITVDYNGNQVLAAYAPVQIKDLNWGIVAKINKAEAFAPIRSLWWSMGVVACAGTILILILALFIAQSITRPISRSTAFAQQLSRGDFTENLSISQKDEIGILSRALNEMLDNLRNMIREIVEGAETLSASSTELSSISQQMTANSGQTSENSRTVASAAEEMSTNMTTVAAAAEQAASNITSIATGSEEMTATINETARNTEKARDMTSRAVSEAENASNTVQQLGEAAQEIGKVTETITEISEQTNLLALNATIEAARAGEAGKGFAVVANEIKELAKQTAEATEEIRSKIDGIQNKTSGTVTRIQQISTVINEVNELVTNIASAVEEQSITTQEMASNISQAAQGVEEATRNVTESSTVAKDIAKEIADVNQAAEELSNNSTQVSVSAKELSKLAEKLHQLVEVFRL